MAINKWINKIRGKNNINMGSPFKINNDAIIKIINDGKKLIRLNMEIEMEIKQWGKLDSLIKFLLSTRLVAEEATES